MANAEMPICWNSLAANCYIPKYRSNRPEVFFKETVEKKLRKLAGKNIFGVSF